MPITAGLPQFASPIGDPSFGRTFGYVLPATGVGGVGVGAQVCTDTTVPRYRRSLSHHFLHARSLIPSRANHQPTFMLACIRDVGSGKLRIHTYRTPPGRKRPQPPPLAGETSRENFRTKTAVASPASQCRQGADGVARRYSRAHATLAGDFRTTAAPLGAGSPSL